MHLMKLAREKSNLIASSASPTPSEIGSEAISSRLQLICMLADWFNLGRGRPFRACEMASQGKANTHTSLVPTSGDPLQANR